VNRTSNPPPKVALLVSTEPSSAGVEEMLHRAAAGEWPRKDWLEVALRLDAEVIDVHHLRTRAAPLARWVARVAGLAAGQVCEAFLRRRRYAHVLVWADRLGLPLALLLKLAPARPDVVLRSVDLAYWKKALLVRGLRAHTAFRAIVTPSSAQLEIAVRRLGVPRAKLHLDPHGVDTRSWRPEEVAQAGRAICAVGWEARDYETLVAAVRGLDVDVEVAVGSLVLPSRTSATAPVAASSRWTRGYRLSRGWRARAGEAEAARVHWHHQLDRRALRDLYARSRFVVVPLFDVEFDAGATAILEAMAMGKAVVLTRTRGQVDLVEDGVHGVYVAPRDPADLRRAIERLLDDPGLAERMGRAGRERAERSAIEGYAERIARLVLGG